VGLAEDGNVPYSNLRDEKLLLLALSHAISDNIWLHLVNNL
jgi:hypothetical protein